MEKRQAAWERRLVEGECAQNWNLGERKGSGVDQREKVDLGGG